jgi:hypothetical protein
MRKEYFTKEQLADRIKELRDLRGLITDREAVLVDLYHLAIEGDCAVDFQGKKDLKKTTIHATIGESMPLPKKKRRNKEIVRRILKGEPAPVIADFFNVSKQRIGAIFKREVGKPIRKIREAEVVHS